jgi:hypothetical protein
MPDPIVTLTTDFGDGSLYVAAMKGVVLAVNPLVRLLDLSHQIPPQDVHQAALFLAAAVPYFPATVIHVVVVDPGVGSDRHLLYVEVAGHRFLAPDNGCWTALPGDTSKPPTVIRLTEPRYWRHPVSATFHGRDILAPVAGHLSLGLDARLLGSPAETWVCLETEEPRWEVDRIRGKVAFIDRFGNLITNIPGEVLSTQAAWPVRIRVAEQEIPRQVRTYAEAEPGTLVALVSSSGWVEIAVTQGSAAQRLQARVGTEVTICLHEPPAA